MAANTTIIYAGGNFARHALPISNYYHLTSNQLLGAIFGTIFAFIMLCGLLILVLYFGCCWRREQREPDVELAAEARPDLNHFIVWVGPAQPVDPEGWDGVREPPPVYHSPEHAVRPPSYQEEEQHGDVRAGRPPSYRSTRS